MAGKAVNAAAGLQCPHGGTVQIISTNGHAKSGGAALALMTDTFAVVGCPFQIPATVPIPSPCVTVRWILGDLRSSVGGRGTLSQTSAGLCLSAAQVPQGPVAIVSTQAAMGTQ